MSGKVLCTNTGYFQGTATFVSHCRLLTSATLCAPAGQGAACGFAVCHSGKPASLSPGKYLRSIVSTQMNLQKNINIAENVFFLPSKKALTEAVREVFYSYRSERKIATCFPHCRQLCCGILQSFWSHHCIWKTFSQPAGYTDLQCDQFLKQCIK